MRTTRRLLKFLVFAFVLLIISLGYRLFGEKHSGGKTGIFNIDQASADIPIGSCASAEGGTSGSICDGCGAEGGCAGCSGASSK